MLSIALRGVAANPFRYLATAIAIMLGVTFFATTSVLSDSIESAQKSSITESLQDVHVVVRSSWTIETAGLPIRRRVSSSLADDIDRLEGVKAAVAFQTGYAQVVGSDGKTIDTPGLITSTYQGYVWIDNDNLNPFRIAQGRAPKAIGEVVIDSETFGHGDFALGSSVRVLPLSSATPFTIIGTISRDRGSLPGQWLSFSPEAAELVFETSSVDLILVEAVDGIAPADLASSIGSQLGPGFEAITGQALIEEYHEFIADETNIVRVGLQAFAAVALFVGALIIYNTFTITLAQRTRDLALLRALGASRRQVLTSVLAESVVIGMIGSAAGAIGGIAVGWLLIQLLGQFFASTDVDVVIPAGSLAIGVLIGTLVTTASALLPALGGSRVAPIEAMRASAIEPGEVSFRRIGGGLVLAAAGLTLSIAAAHASDYRLLIPGIPLVVLSVALLSPLFMRPISRIVFAPFTRAGSITAELARENVSRHPKRTSTTSLTLMIGVALVVTATLLAGAIERAWQKDQVDRIVADHVIEVTQPDGGLDSEVLPAVAATQGVNAAVSLRWTGAEIHGSFANVYGATTAQIEQAFRLDVVQGRVSDMQLDEVAVSLDSAENNGLSIGDKVEVRFSEEAATLIVVGIYDVSRDFFLVSDWLVDNATLDARTRQTRDTRIFLNTQGDAATIQSISDLLADEPTARVKTTREFVSGQLGFINTVLYIVYGLLTMSVIVALVGILNTLALSIYERTRELGLMRAVGMTSGQLYRTILGESMIIALIGTCLGLLLGLFSGIVTGVTAGLTTSDFEIAWRTLGLIAILGILAGLLAGVLPGRRASRLNVLDAIASE